MELSAPTRASALDTSLHVTTLAYRFEDSTRAEVEVKVLTAPNAPRSTANVALTIAPERVEPWRYEVEFFNPASNTWAHSVLRIVNPVNESVSITIEAVDAAGEPGEEPIVLTIAPHAALNLRSDALEAGEAEHFDGALGDGAGKWRLDIESTAPALVSSLIVSANGALSNLSN